MTKELVILFGINISDYIYISFDPLSNYFLLDGTQKIVFC